MTVHVLDVDVVWLNDAEVCSLSELAELSGLSPTEIDHLLESGAITAAGGAPDRPAVAISTVTLARTARRLRDDFELAPSGLCVAMNLLQRIRELERQLDEAYARHPRL
jgi:chaperone modulatory protein CbpM